MKKTLVAALLCGASVVGVSVGSASADGTPTHDHFLMVNGERIQVGPHVCANSNLHRAFHNFHSNVHMKLAIEQNILTIQTSLCIPAS